MAATQNNSRQRVGNNLGLEQPHLIHVLICAVFVLCPVTPAAADPWLDRVERNLRRIDSAGQYSTPLKIGSKAAVAKHKDCIRKEIEAACAQLIWREPDLLPVEDWAIGTAHIKRGELREKRGDVAGALQDYRDARGYHDFVPLKARIKRLELRQKRDAEKSLAAETSATVANKETPQSPARPVTARVLNSADGDFALLADRGWDVTVTAASSDESAKPLESKLAPTAEARRSSAPSAPQAAAGQDKETAFPGHADAVELQQSGVPLLPAQHNNIIAPYSHADWQDEPHGSKVLHARPEVRRHMQTAARLIPGQVAAKRQALGAEEAAMASAQVAASESETSAAPIAMIRDKPRSQALDPEQSLNSEPAVHQFKLDDQASQTLARVRRATDQVLTTSALPDRPASKKSPSQRLFATLTFMALATALILSSFGLVFGSRLPLPRRVAESDARTQSLSVDDLEAMFKKQVQKKASEDETPVSRQTPVVAIKTAKGGGKDTAPDTAGAGKAESDARPARKHPPPPVPKDRVGGEEASAPDANEGAKSPAPGSHPNQIKGIDRSLLRRVSNGSASLIIVGGGDNRRQAITAICDEPQRKDLEGRSVRLSASAEDAAGSLNLFAAVQITTDVLAMRQRFNAAFEFHCCVFESIFGLRFVNDKKVVLRHLILLLQSVPDGSLKRLYEFLQTRRLPESWRDTVSEIEDVSTRLFFTTVFRGDEFASDAEWMRNRLKPVIESPLIEHLCCKQGAPQALARLTGDGRLIHFPVDLTATPARDVAILVKCLLARLALNSCENGDRSDEVATYIHTPDLASLTGGSKEDAAFLMSQVKRAGYHII